MTARLDAIAALEKALDRLDEPMTALDRLLLAATIEHARDCVEQIQEVKRIRKAKVTG